VAKIAKLSALAAALVVIILAAQLSWRLINYPEQHQRAIDRAWQNMQAQNYDEQPLPTQIPSIKVIQQSRHYLQVYVKDVYLCDTDLHDFLGCIYGLQAKEAPTSDQRQFNRRL
jgi:hypothetical protein